MPQSGIAAGMYAVPGKCAGYFFASIKIVDLQGERELIF
jgi:hypothetical protein